jgi:hypothetical protein
MGVLSDALDTVRPGAVVTETGDGHVFAEWPNGDRIGLRVDGGTVHWLNMWAVKSRDGLLSDCAAVTPAYFREQGCKAFTASPGDQDAELALRRVGFVDGDGGLACPIRKGGRMDSYTAFKAGDKPEPKWHEALNA